MKIAVVHGSSIKNKNKMLFEMTQIAAPQAEVINLGVTYEDELEISYVETSLLVALLLQSKAVDFVVTGCSSGQGMMLACNNWPEVVCGYLPTPQDAFLFGRINGGNTASLPLGLGYGWNGEINLQDTLTKLFEGEFGCGYPPESAQRKQYDAKLAKELGTLCKRNPLEVIKDLDSVFLKNALANTRAVEYILHNGKEKTLLKELEMVWNSLRQDIYNSKPGYIIFT